MVIVRNICAVSVIDFLVLTFQLSKGDRAVKVGIVACTTNCRMSPTLWRPLERCLAAGLLELEKCYRSLRGQTTLLGRGGGGDFI